MFQFQSLMMREKEFADITDADDVSECFPAKGPSVGKSLFVFFNEINNNNNATTTTNDTEMMMMQQ